MMDIDFKKINKIHFVGIGGVGVSAVAKMMAGMGKIVSGSDRDNSKITETFKDMGVEIFTGHNGDNLDQETELLVYSPAIGEDNPERMKAFDLAIPQISYPQALGILSKNHKTIAISGTHGKTTTTAMIAKVLIDNDLKPTVIVGSILKEQGSNFIEGSNTDGSIFLVEACEYKRSFLNLYPDILVITNIDLDHLDYYKDLEDIQSAFLELALRIPNDGFLICDKENENLKPVVEKVKCQVIDYRKIEVDGLDLKFPGQHNILNSKCALGVAGALNISKDKVIKSLNNFAGTWRRFEYKGKAQGGAFVYDDYAHAPKEVESTILAAKEKYPDKNINLVFQPHLYSRTKLLFGDFVKALSLADKILILPIYAAREKEDESINSVMIVESLKELGNTAVYLDDFGIAQTYLRDSLGEDDVLITMGAGDVYKIGESII